MWSNEQERRLYFEQALLEHYLGLRMDIHNEYAFLTTPYRAPNSDRQFQLVLEVRSLFPEEMPHLYIVEPFSLMQRNGEGTVNSLRASHAFHTSSNGPGGCVQICHCVSWNPSMTCVQVMDKGFLWISAYLAYLETGVSIDSFFQNLSKQIRRNGGCHEPQH